MAIDLTPEEKEILALKATWETVDAMVNYEVLSLSHRDPESEIRFNTPTHGKYFNIMLLDFLHSKIFGLDKDVFSLCRTFWKLQPSMKIYLPLEAWLVHSMTGWKLELNLSMRGKHGRSCFHLSIKISDCKSSALHSSKFAEIFPNTICLA